MFARGLKRKSADGEDSPPAPPSYSLQRQSLLDMSLVKLQLCHMLVEPNLCRSVLIANTVRQLQEDLSLDAAWRLPAPPGAGRGPLERLVSTDILCRSPWEQQGGHSAPDSGGSPAPDLCELPGAPSAQAPRSAPGCAWEADRPRGGFQASLDQILETLESRAPRAAEGLFADVDGPYYDLDAVLTGMVGAKAVPGDGFEALASAGAPPPGSSCKRDLGELDHVVEILVET
ncbi:cell division cycle-associated protein 4 [Pipistrellus kuhlii]|uniref:Cell division cycle associated 4 n=1 Tax=Pipistrellus kuhlii TaxID=59472 RepID=A0A7J7R1S1_PIPKU|nr:cell division cycle-associated protein 4 [Pipistrellus kuhlii]XP_045434806.1 cell division cycle-associated protein 4 [Pipistrellus kuhlii]XP_045434807.1 cell division cycle-associated protein 4 [Pipistrellus kuhlii]XP_045434808.1 cell division cycle-associated protein 4 [Pipistrellus kuhlii]XP_045434809.1 cell division cycle-associated protein 4 [Pipistrellus kuhlii]XP_045434810.1 cell division cycle-associated protein 4 [Pipistrellus kuhlii]KAF6270098.1 cell division cycle associated 4 [